MPELVDTGASRRELLRRWVAGSTPRAGIPRRPDPTAAAPLSAAQQRIWFLEQLFPERATYTMPLALRLRGHLDIAALQGALSLVVARHESLRTSIEVREGVPVQVVGPIAPLPMTVVGPAQLDPTQPLADATAQVERFSRTVFDLSGPLVEVLLVRLAADDAIFAVAMHHIISDGWSLGVFATELMSAYADLTAGRHAPELPELPLQYPDYAVWLRDLAQRDKFGADLDYWRGVLGDEPPLVTFHPDRPRALEPENRGARVPFTIPAPVLTGLRKLADEVRVNERPATLFVALMAGFKALLRYYTGAEDITVGTPIAGRNRPEIEPLIGFFVNALALRTDLSGSPTFRELLAREQRVVFDAFDHQDAPFDLVVEHVRPDRELSHSPLFRTAVVLQNTSLPELTIPGLSAEYVEVHSGTTKFDVLVTLRQVGAELVGAFEYDVDLYDEPTVTAIAAHFVALLSAVVADPDTALPELDFLENGERQRAVAAALPCTPAAEARHTLHELFAVQAAKTPEAVALTFGDSALTYAELATAAAELAQRLLARGVGRGSFVGIHLERGADVVIAILAVLRAGAAYVPLDPMYPADRIEFMIADSGARLVISHSSLVAGTASTGPELLLIDEQPERSTSDLPLPQAEPHDPCYVIYTSGSTGVPKGVVIEHANVVRLFSTTTRWYDFGPRDVWTMFHSYSFDFAVWEMWGALLYGGRLVVVPGSVSRSTAEFADLLARERVTVLNQTPSAFTQLLRALENAPATELAVRWVIFGGEALDLAILTPWFDRFGQAARLVNMYGITETTVHVTYRELTRADVESAAGSLIGVPLPDLGVLIVDPAGRPVPDGVAGEMLVCGPGVGRGYLNRDELTAERFVTSPVLDGRRVYRTGDLARRRADGDLEYLGRIDQQIKVRGFRIELGEIEAAITAHPGVDQSVVLARKDTGGNVSLVAYFTPGEQAADAAGAEQDQVANWQVVFNSTYRQGRDGDADFDISGWNSSYTNAAIPEEHMREWVDATVAAVRSLAPRRVLEIGCGTGLLLSRLAPLCEVYDATDVSASAIENVRTKIVEPDPGLAHVRLDLCAADALPDDLAGSYDVVLINSVVQYFPSADYLTRVLHHAAGLLAPEGVLFVGDVRDLLLSESFHATVEATNAPSAGAGELAPAVRAALDRDAELVIAPRYFEDLVAASPVLTGSRMRLKRGVHLNEMSRFRYDAVLYAGSRGLPVRPKVFDASTTPQRLAEILTRDRPAAVLVTDVLDARVAGPLALVEELRRGRAGAAQIRAVLADSGGVSPEDYLALAERVPYRIEALRRPGGRYDVVATGWEVALSGAPARAVEWPEDLIVSDPLRVKARDDLVVDVRAHLARRLPQHMVPAAVLVLDEFPLTANGKLDRRALPAPVLRRNTLEYEPPRTPLEQRVAGVFAQVLGIPRVGREDNFFDLGGHSLLAAQLILRLKETFGEDIPLGSLFARPTVTGVVALLSGEAATEETIDLPAEVAAIVEAWPAGPWPLTPPRTGEVLLTGATGFVGAFLLRELLARTDSRVHCLVRADTPEAGLARLAETFDTYELPRTGFDRVVPVLGDLAEPRLGLSEKQFLLLGRTIDAIYHNGAHVNFALPYRVLEAANVRGTDELITLARTSGAPLHFVSSLYVLGPGDAVDGVVTERVPAQDPSRLSLGYLRSKWVAERLVCAAGARGLPVSVFRLGRIGGDSRTGACQTSDFFWLLVKASQEVGRAPEVDFAVDLAPADFTGAAMVELARDARPGTHIYHLRNPVPGSFTEAVGWLRDSGTAVALVGLDEWRAAIAAHAAEAGPGSASYSVLSLLSAGDGLTPLIRFDVDDAVTALDRVGVQCPPVAHDLFTRYLDYFRKVGFLAAPSPQEVGV
ncbi:amino acid adenylation domain-containing protein [Nocardia brasiliensis]|uniref:Amino acid adenylation domain-containing protein n=1 Tax=Nocardia brasiliensis TaxID=37326 RepID=A0A6G9XRI5_NOCBR|nr:non-ribosomal peptide synthetase [Nocardia brasiliensis]QIS03534.1 amino acid adenylation domain-containing protein [Nocardia brasiliensis]